MENSEQVLSESCNSYRWLMCIKSSLDSLGDSHRSFDTQDSSSFIEVDPECISLRWAIDANGFGFDLPRSESSDCILFSSGLLQLPVLDKSESLSSSTSLLSLPNHCRSISSSLISSTLFHSAHDTPSSRSLASRNAKLRHCAGCLKKVIWRYMCFLMHLCEKVKALRLTPSRSEKSRTNLAGSSQRTSDSRSSIECCPSYADISIHDAILHCKKSNVAYISWRLGQEEEMNKSYQRGWKHLKHLHKLVVSRIRPFSSAKEGKNDLKRKSWEWKERAKSSLIAPATSARPVANPNPSARNSSDGAAEGEGRNTEAATPRSSEPYQASRSTAFSDLEPPSLGLLPSHRMSRTPREGRRRGCQEAWR
ncbi:hypothetical protein MUK42_21394 [Musa troglodytarum]|uniref:Uncharacterized protein n=1 Tax=Musa troglodytarum TaxID=320322 RepID=A0A9E7K3I5_9LILI|nr:hypothetical protein MUK42_21394 [Musa troglodytarum]